LHPKGFVLRLLRTAFAFLLLFPSRGAPLSARSKGSTTSRVDQDYVLALATADRLLHAWQTQDEEAGILMLTDRLKQRTSQDMVQNFFSSGAVTRESFEIGRGKKVGPKRYAFPVALFQKSAGHAHKWMRPQNSGLVVVKAGDDWAIDQLP
jgi:hypothetical protein